VVVVAKSGGDFTTITDALNSITDATFENPYLVWVGPGVYTETVQMKPSVDIEGVGNFASKIVSTGGPSWTAASVTTAGGSELRSVWVSNIGGHNYATAVYAPTNGFGTLRDVRATAQGGTNSNYGIYIDEGINVFGGHISASGGINSYGIANYEGLYIEETWVSAGGSSNSNYAVYNYGLSNTTMTDVDARASSGGTNYAVYNFDTRPIMIDVTAEATSGSNSGYGVYNDDSSPEMRNVRATGRSGPNPHGVYNTNQSNPLIVGGTIVGSHGTSHSYGIGNYGGSWPTLIGVKIDVGGTAVFNNASYLTMTDVVITASGAAANYGVRNTASSGTYYVTVDNSTISATGNTNYTIYNDAEFITRIGSSKMNGGPVVTGGGTVACAGVHDENYVFFASTCP
jgi:hypothetical protein